VAQGAALSYLHPPAVIIITTMKKTTTKLITDRIVNFYCLIQKGNFLNHENMSIINLSELFP